MKIVKTINELTFNLEKIVIAILLFIIFASLVSSVIFRYFFNSPIHWSEEVAMYSLAWVTFVGGSMTIKGKQSAVISLLLDKVKGRTYLALETICNLFVFAFSLYILIISINWVSSPYILFEKSSATQMPMLIPYLSVPVGFLFMSIHSFNILVVELVTSLRGIKMQSVTTKSSQKSSPEVVN